MSILLSNFFLIYTNPKPPGKIHNIFNANLTRQNESHEYQDMLLQVR